MAFLSTSYSRFICALAADDQSKLRNCQGRVISSIHAHQRDPQQCGEEGDWADNRWQVANYFVTTATPETTDSLPYIAWNKTRYDTTRCDTVYRVGQKSKLLILSEYVNKTEKIWGMWTNMNSYRENEVLSDICTWNILRHNCFMFKYSMTESNQWNYC